MNGICKKCQRYKELDVRTMFCRTCDPDWNDCPTYSPDIEEEEEDGIDE